MIQTDKIKKYSVQFFRIKIISRNLFEMYVNFGNIKRGYK